MNLRREFTELECDRFRRYCNFTEEERAVFNLRVKDQSRIAIAETLKMSVATVDRRIRDIKRKIYKIIR